MSLLSLRRPLAAVAATLLGATALAAVGLGGAHGAPAGVATYQDKIKNDGTSVYFPSAASGELPVALLLQGGKVHRQHYSEYAAEIASYGFIVVTPNHRRLNFFDTDYYASTSQVRETLDWMVAENAEAGSALQGRIDVDTLVLLGHSFGGATGLSIAEDKCSIPFCTTLTFDLPAQVKAGSFYGTNNAILGLHPSIDNQIPVQLVQGLDDGTALPAEATATYAKIAQGRKQIVRVTGANHYGITNTQDPSGANAESNPQSLSQAASIEVAARWAALWLKAQLGDQAAADYVYLTGDAADPQVSVTSAP